MIYCIWYPSGGFGHFINAMISLYGQNFYRPGNTFSLSHNGNSHALDLVLPKFCKETKHCYTLPEVDKNYNYTALIDNGIDNESNDFLQYFPTATTIKICYDDFSWPVIALTHVIKAMKADLDTTVPVEPEYWAESVDWSKREKFFLYLRDHEFRHRWRSDDGCKFLQINQLCSYNTMQQSLSTLGIQLDNFQKDYIQWWNANERYFAPVITAEQVVAAVKDNIRLDLTGVNDIWTQAVIYYFIWLHFGREVPHNDFANFFVDTDQIQKWLAQ